jgi:hypothetical protein
VCLANERDPFSQGFGCLCRNRHAIDKGEAIDMLKTQNKVKPLYIRLDQNNTRGMLDPMGCRSVGRKKIPFAKNVQCCSAMQQVLGLNS